MAYPSSDEPGRVLVVNDEDGMRVAVAGTMDQLDDAVLATFIERIRQNGDYRRCTDAELVRIITERDAAAAFPEIEDGGNEFAWAYILTPVVIETVTLEWAMDEIDLSPCPKCGALVDRCGNDGGEWDDETLLACETCAKTIAAA